MKTQLKLEYHIDILSCELDGIIALQFKHKMTDFTLILIGLYILPENSVYGPVLYCFALVYTALGGSKDVISHVTMFELK